MMSNALRFLFAVSNNVDLANAKAVRDAGVLPNCAFFLMTDGSVVEDVEGFSVHTPAVSFGRLSRLTSGVAFDQSTVLIVPQDFGIVARVLIAAARKRGACVVVMPDGILSSDPIRNHKGLRRVAQRGLSRVLTVTKLAAPSNDYMGGSRPDYVFRWGPGWASSFMGGADTKYLDVGCPRMDRLALVDPPGRDRVRLLLCSQPLFIPEWSRPFVDDWYEFLSRMVSSAPEEIEVRVRLHPSEDAGMVPGAVIAAAKDSSTVENDLRWSTVVAAPFSTVLLEAAASSRRAIALYRDSLMLQKIVANPFFASNSVLKVPWRINDLVESCRVDHDSHVDRRFLANHGSAAESVAEALIGLPIEVS